MSFIKEFLKSPAFHFVLLGSFLFLVYGKLKPTSTETISITSQTIDALVLNQSNLQLGEVSDQQRGQLLKSHIEDEVLLRVAYQRGLDKNDMRVRKRLLSIIRNALTEVVPEPSYSQLQAFYNENKNQYLTDTTWSFDQVFFNFNSEKLPEDPEQFLLQIPHNSNPGQLGNYSGYGGATTKTSFNQMALTFGKSFAEKVIELPPNRWAGPINSILGVHYINVTEKNDPNLAPFEQMEAYLRQDYIFRKTRELQEDKIVELARQYEIIVNGEQVELGN